MLLSVNEEVSKIEETAVNRYQINDIKSLWQTYDPNGNGYLNYKYFWKFSSQIAVIFGVNISDLLDLKTKKNFMSLLDMTVYEHTKEQIFCYQFHEVVTKMAKISVMLKYGIVKFINYYYN